MVVSLEKDFAQPALTYRVVLGIELVEAVERIAVLDNKLAVSKDYNYMGDIITK